MLLFDHNLNHLQISQILFMALNRLFYQNPHLYHIIITIYNFLKNYYYYYYYYLHKDPPPFQVGLLVSKIIYYIIFVFILILLPLKRNFLFYPFQYICLQQLVAPLNIKLEDRRLFPILDILIFLIP